MNETTRQELHDLLGHLRDGQLRDEQTARLEAIIAADPEARAEYVDYVFLCASLRDHHQAEASAEQPAVIAAIDASGQVRRVSPWSVAAAMLISVGVAVALMSQWSARPQMLAAEGVAVLTRAVDAQWDAAPANLAVGAALPPGKLKLARGLAQIEFYSGATVILEGPAELDLVAADRGYFHHGRIRTHVPPQASGFTIGAPGVNVVDLGTEFGMSIGPGGAAEVHVFDGKVELHHADRRVQAVSTGEAVQLPGGSVPLNRAAFVDPSRLDALADAQVERLQRRWSAWRQRVRGDDTVLADFGFRQPQGWGRSLRNEATGGNVADGAIVGCQWVEGRWPGRAALDFKRSSDRVRINVPGTFESLTFAAWVRIDGLDRWLSSLMLTDEWAAGTPHWQLSWDGQMVLGIGGHRWRNFTSPKGIIGAGDLGRWVHLATVYDAGARTVTHYRDGKPVYVGPIPTPTPLVIGPAEIGNWARPIPDDNKLRNFNGRIDEFVIWARALPAGEIEAMYEAGRPN